MFMDRRELKNALGLYKIRNREARLSHFILYAIPIFLFVLDLFGVFTQVFSAVDQVVAFELNTYSKLSFFFIMVFSLGLAFNYNNFNREHEVLPQTNKSRFFSYVLYNYMLFLKISILSLAVYLLQYGIISILASFNGNIHLAYDFSIAFVIWGFIVNLIYGFLAICVFIFIGALDRKFGLIFRIVIGALALLSIISFNGTSMGTYIMKIVCFWTKEPSLILFTLKGVALWLFISGVSWIINSNTIYFKSQSDSHFSKGLVISIGLFLIITISTVFIFMSSSTISSHNKEVSVSETVGFGTYDGYTQIPVDCSNLKEGDVIKITTTPSTASENLSIWTISEDDYDMNNTDIHGLHVSYDLGKHMVDDVSLTDFYNPEVTAKIEGNNLYINYSYKKNQKVLMLSPYNFMNQFEAFKGKTLYNSVFGSYRSSSNISVRIISDRGIRVTPIQ